MIHCTGCHRGFTVSGYTLHIQRTRTAACIAAYHAEVDNMDLTEDGNNAEVFRGDFFGDYQREDFDWPDDEQGPAEGIYLTLHVSSVLFTNVVQVLTAKTSRNASESMKIILT
jgi:hypothetical protein